jgi:hypothetical protein
VHPVSAITQRATWCSDVLLTFTMAASGTCHHSARDARPPLPVDTLDNGYISSVAGIGTTPGGRTEGSGGHEQIWRTRSEWRDRHSHQGAGGISGGWSAVAVRNSKSW